MRAVTHSFGNGRSGKPPFKTPQTEAERLAANRSADAVGVIRIKTDDAQRDLIISEGVTPLESAACSSGQTSGTSLVAGDVTGGGGKAT